MKANGLSESLRFSARLKWTRPTSRQRLSRLRRKAWIVRPLSASSSSSARSSARQSEARHSESRYSPPRIGGASSRRATRSSAAGSETRGSPPAAGSPQAQTAATKRMAKARQKPSSGGRRLPASADPSCSRPCPLPRAKAASSRPATPSSSPESAAICSRRSAPCGVRTGTGVSGIGAIESRGMRRLDLIARMMRDVGSDELQFVLVDRRSPGSALGRSLGQPVVVGGVLGTGKNTRWRQLRRWVTCWVALLPCPRRASLGQHIVDRSGVRRDERVHQTEAVEGPPVLHVLG